MVHSTGKLPNDHYINGLRESDSDVLVDIYTEFRTPVIRTITTLGGSEADGAIFFRAAVVEAARQARAGELPLSVPIFYQLRELALAHYHDWDAERVSAHTLAPTDAPQPTMPFADDTTGPVFPEGNAHSSTGAESDEVPSTGTEQTTVPAFSGVPVVPPTGILRQTRRNIYAWRHFEKMNGRQQSEVLSAARQGTDSTSLRQYLDSMKVTDAAPGLMPAWISQALLDVEGYEFWRKTQALERRISNREPLGGAAPTTSNKWAWIIIGLLATWLIGNWAYKKLTRDLTPQEVYQENFQPPASILEDLQSRQATDTMSLLPLPQRLPACEELLRQADANYREKDYSSAATVLYRIAEDEELSACHADAWFYLGVVAMQMDEPELTLQCFAKIDNLDRFGEDISWYQALAFVKMADHQPEMRERAIRALERASGASTMPARQQQAAQMLQKLQAAGQQETEVSD